MIHNPPPRALTIFAQRVAPWFKTPEHVRFLAEQLEAVESGECRRLAISCPPGHGKSTLMQAFIAWYIGRDAARRVLAISGNGALARHSSRCIRGMVESPESSFAAKLSGESLEEWRTSEQGGVRAVGRDGPVPAFRAEICLVDGLQIDAGTPASRDDDERWFREVVSTRLEPNGAVILFATRLHEDDLIGRLKAGSSAKEWRFIDLPAIANSSDLLGRSEGEALWPERWPLELLTERKAEVGSMAFSCQYQGAP